MRGKIAHEEKPAEAEQRESGQTAEALRHGPVERRVIEKQVPERQAGHADTQCSPKPD